MTIEADFENAVEMTNKMLSLAGAMRDLPAHQRRSLVFQALVLAEAGSSLNGAASKRAPAKSAPTSSKAKATKASSGGGGGGGDNPRAAMLALLRAKPETPVA